PKDQKDKKEDKGPSDGNPQPKTGMDPGGMQPKDGKDPMAGKGGRRPRQGETDAKEPDKKDEKDPGGMAKADPKKDMNPEPGKADPKMDPKDPMGGMAGGNPGNPMGPPSGKPTLPLDDEVAKEVWGHLPDQLRKQVTQYYKEQFMPKYSDLLK